MSAKDNLPVKRFPGDNNNLIIDLELFGLTVPILNLLLYNTIVVSHIAGSVIPKNISNINQRILWEKYTAII